MSKLFTVAKIVTLLLMFENHGVCFLQTAAVDEDNNKLAWAVRRLVQPVCENASEDENMPTFPPCTNCLSKPGKRGPPGPKGDRGPKGDKENCTCGLMGVGDLTEIIQDLQDQIYHIKATFPDTVDSQWIEVDLGKIQKVTGIVTQGAAPAQEWVTSLKVEYGTIAGSRQVITENNNAKIFSPVNTNNNEKAIIRFQESIMARYIRIIPMSYNNHISMRFDVIYC